MNASQLYILVAVIVLAVLAVFMFMIGKKGIGKRLTPLASYAFAFILAGILFGENKWVGYGLLGIGVTFAILDMINKLKVKQ